MRDSCIVWGLFGSCP